MISKVSVCLSLIYLLSSQCCVTLDISSYFVWNLISSCGFSILYKLYRAKHKNADNEENVLSFPTLPFWLVHRNLTCHKQFYYFYRSVNVTFLPLPSISLLAGNFFRTGIIHLFVPGMSQSKILPGVGTGGRKWQ